MKGTRAPDDQTNIELVAEMLEIGADLEVEVVLEAILIARANPVLTIEAICAGALAEWDI